MSEEIHVVKRYKRKVYFMYRGKNCKANKYGVVMWRQPEPTLSKILPGYMELLFFSFAESEKLLAMLDATYEWVKGEKVYCYNPVKEKPTC